MAGATKKGKTNGAAAASENKSFNHGDIVLARLRGYPPWPARITKPEDAPKNVQSQKPGKGGGTYCVLFFPEGNYAWLNAKEINSLPKDAIEAFLKEPHRKGSGNMREGYETALDPTDWDNQQAEYRRINEEERAAQEEGYDELEEDDDAPSGGKRKRDSKPKAAKKKAKKASKADVESEEEAPKSKKAAAAPKPAASKAPESKPADDDPLANDPECVKVKDWRHKLQRGFLGKGLPEAHEMTNYDDIFKTIEGYKNMTIQALQYSKIGKVMKKIAVLEGIPRNEELKITERASKLMTEWQNFIDGKGTSSEQANGTAAPAKTESAAPEPAASTETKPTEAPAASTETKQETESKPAETTEAAPAQPASATETSVPSATLPTPLYPAVNGQ